MREKPFFLQLNVTSYIMSLLSHNRRDRRNYLRRGNIWTRKNILPSRCGTILCSTLSKNQRAVFFVMTHHVVRPALQTQTLKNSYGRFASEILRERWRPSARPIFSEQPAHGFVLMTGCVKKHAPGPVSTGPLISEHCKDSPQISSGLQG